jgi:two-component system, LytTR family, response regulator
MRALIVDDEPLSRTALARVLQSRKDVEFFDTADSGTEALQKLEKSPFDVLLLDICMPELSGIDLVDCLNSRVNSRNESIPAVVFVTAHHEHAVTAFEKHAVDYILKPFPSERVDEALNIALRRTSSERVAKLLDALTQIKDTRPKSAKVAIKSKGRIFFIDPAEVRAVEAQGNYVLLHGQSGSYLLRESISGVAEKLAPYGFIRVHRSVLVNGAFIQEIQPWVTGEYVVRVAGGKEYTASRTYKDNLKAITHVWIGVGSETVE